MWLSSSVLHSLSVLLCNLMTLTFKCMGNVCAKFELPTRLQKIKYTGNDVLVMVIFVFSAVTLLARRQEWHRACESIAAAVIKDFLEDVCKTDHRLTQVILENDVQDELLADPSHPRK